MSIIQNIRNKYAKVAGGVIALALVGFILSDAASGSVANLFGRSTEVASVSGEDIDAMDYNQRVREYEVIYAMNTNGQPMDDNTRMQIRDQALREMISDVLINQQAEKLGITTSEDEAKSLIYGANPDPLVQQYPIFRNPETGMFDPQRVKMYEQQIMQIDPTGGEKERWETYKKFVIRNNSRQRLQNMIGAAAYYPKFEVEKLVNEQAEQASFNFVKVPYTSIPDAEVKITDADLKAYIEKRKKSYTINVPTRGIEYVAFNVIPSAADTARSLNAIMESRNELINTNDIEGFVARYSDDTYNNRFVTKESFGSTYADSIFNLPIGSVYGPYFENNSYRLAKVVDKKTYPDSVNAKHVLISTQQGRSEEAAKKTADSIYALVVAGAPIDSLALTMSEDEGSKEKGGDLGFFKKDQMVPEFDSVCFNGKPGTVAVVKTQFGYHVIKVGEQHGMVSGSKIAVITKSLFPGDETENKMYAAANEFAGKYGNEKGFDEGVKAMNLTKLKAENIKASDFMVQGINDARDIVRWIFDSKKGQVSDVINLKDKYIVAKVTTINDAGLMNIDDQNKPMIEQMVRNEKKAKLIADKYKGQNSLQGIATAAGQVVGQADSVSLTNPFVPNLGYELKAIGYAFSPSFKPGTVSPGIQGQDGVIFLQLNSRNKVELPEAVKSTLMNQKSLREQQMRQNLTNIVFESLKNSSKIEYNVNNF